MLHAQSAFFRWGSICAFFLLVGAVTTQAADSPGPTQEELRKMASAAPGRAAALPLQPRRLLVFTLCRGYVHASIPFGAKAIESMGAKTGAFKTVISDDIAHFAPENLKQFDAVCFVSALGELFLPPDLEQLSPDKQELARQADQRLKKGLLDYLKSGKGFAGIHGASALFPTWSEFGDALGGWFLSHPWNSTDKIAVKIDDPTHPLVTVFNGQGFEIIDEGYQFKDPYSRKRNRVLYSLDTAKTDMNKKELRADGDFGLCWVRRCGAGRIFYTALGHNSEEFWNPLLLRHILDGLQFALGDLPAPTDPIP
jgi:hypothetical protein